MNVEDYMARAPTFAVYDGFCKTKSVMDQHSRILVSISGGSDSDDMVDVVEHLKPGSGCEVDYVWFNTGIEMDATKAHIPAVSLQMHDGLLLHLQPCGCKHLLVGFQLYPCQHLIDGCARLEIDQRKHLRIGVALGQRTQHIQRTGIPKCRVIGPVLNRERLHVVVFHPPQECLEIAPAGFGNIRDTEGHIVLDGAVYFCSSLCCRLQRLRPDSCIQRIRQRFHQRCDAGQHLCSVQNVLVLLFLKFQPRLLRDLVYEFSHRRSP